MLTRRKSENYPNRFIPRADIMDADVSSVCQGVYTFDNPKDNPQPDFPYLVRVGGGYRGFRSLRHAKVYYSED